MNYLLDAIAAWKASRSKLRPESNLHQLLEEQLAEVLGLMLQGMSYLKAKAYCAEEWQVDISTGTLATFYSEVSPFVLSSRRRLAVQGANTIGEDIKQSASPDYDTVLAELIKQSAFEVLSSPAPPEKQLNLLVNAVLKMRDQSRQDKDIEIKLRRLELLEKQSSEAQETVGNSKLTDAEKAARLREIFKR